MDTCWCGSRVNRKYSEHYYVCDKCCTLVSDVDFSDKIVHVENEDKDLYGKNYWEKMMCRLTGKNSLDEVIDYYLQERAIYWIQYLMKYRLPKAKVAEIGAGLGQLCYLLKQAGYEPYGFELSGEICAYAENTLKINMHRGDISAVSGQYDMIAAFDLLEHLVNPRDFVSQCARHLKEDGILCFQTPCYDPSLTYEEMKEKAPRFESLLTEFQHINLFSRNSMKKLLKESGFSYICFEPAVFGDDYDMFVFASRQPMKKNTDDEINRYLNSAPRGRLIKSMITLYTQVNEKQRVIEELVAYKDYLESLRN